MNLNGADRIPGRMATSVASIGLIALAGLGGSDAAALEAAPVPVNPSLKWSGDGHRLVCQIAWGRLTPEAQRRVDELMAQDPLYDDFPSSCVWADAVRAQIRDGVPDVQRLAPYTPAHYVNTPRGQVGVDRQACAQEGPDSPPRCVLDGIAEMKALLATSQDMGQRLEALKFLAHFIGDVHQPLHAGYGSDRGGNNFEVSIMGLPGQNLHGAWDFFFLEYEGRHWRDLADELGQRITAVDARLWGHLDPVEWADESYQLVEREVYRDLDPDGAYLGRRYYDRHILTVERQLMKAGVRLALVLNGILDPEG